MITQIKDLVVPPRPAQHLSSGLVGQRVSVSVSQHITHTRVDTPPRTRGNARSLLAFGDIFGAAGDGRAPEAGLARCGQLMKAALCPLAGWSAGPSWETKWVCPQIKRPQTEL